MSALEHGKGAFAEILDTVHRTLLSRKAMAAVTAFVAALVEHRPDLAIAAVSAFVLAEGYVDGKREA